MTSRLRQLSDDQRQSPWLDDLRRGALGSGDLAQLRDRGVRGVTSNPTIFQKAIQGADDYTEQLAELRKAGADVTDAYWQLVGRDIRDACELFAAVHESSDGVDGYVSLEVDPNLAHDTDGTLTAARGLHDELALPNLMVKVPATEEGLPAIRQLIAEGRNVNVTLIFGLERYDAVMQAYLEGLEALAEDPDADLSRVASVASFFVSRVDTEVDRRLDAIGTDEARSRRSRAAVAQAKLAYQRFVTVFDGPRWAALEARGARVQRPLWASTSTKDPALRDTLYVDELIGPDTVTTLPGPTLEAFDDHGTVARRVDAEVEDARAHWTALTELGVDLDDVAVVLEREGVAAFRASFDDLIGTLQAELETPVD